MKVYTIKIVVTIKDNIFSKINNQKKRNSLKIQQ